MAIDIARLRGQLLISCQAFPGDPMEDTETLRRVALAALRGGGKGLRVHSPEHVAILRRETNLPIIGIQKSYRDGELRITPDFTSARALADAGADIIALDCTGRPGLHGEPWQQIVRRIREELDVLVMADISTLEEGIAAAKAGVHLIGTTLYGYTDYTVGATEISQALISGLASDTGLPIIAEGHISTPEDGVRALQAGAWGIVVGSAITRPGVIAEKFSRAISEASSKNYKYALGVDLGGTSVKAGIVDHRGYVSDIVRVPTNASKGRDTIAASMIQAIQTCLGKSNDRHLAGIGVASAGAINAATGVVFAATENLPGWANFAIAEFLQEHFAIPVHVENDAHAAVLAELHFGVGRGMRNFVALTLGTGVGGGVVLGGALQRGAHGFAGTIGHHVIHVDGLPCNCGRRGCLEAYVSTSGLIREFMKLGGIRKVEDAGTALEIASLAANGDTRAVQAYEVLAQHLSEAVANIFNLFDPEAVILSGGLIESYEGMLEYVQSRVPSMIHFGTKRKPTVLKSVAGHMAGVQGAASFFLR